MVLGIALLVTFAISLGAIVQASHVTAGLRVLNWVLVLDALGTVIVGTFVWYFTLEERANFHKVYSDLSPETRIKVQDQVRCNLLRLGFNSVSVFSSSAADITTQPTWQKSEDRFAYLRNSSPLPTMLL